MLAQTCHILTPNHGLARRRCELDSSCTSPQPKRTPIQHTITYCRSPTLSHPIPVTSRSPSAPEHLIGVATPVLLTTSHPAISSGALSPRYRYPSDFAIWCVDTIAFNLGKLILVIKPFLTYVSWGGLVPSPLDSGLVAITVRPINYVPHLVHQQPTYSAQLTPAVYLRIIETLHVDFLSTGRESHLVLRMPPCLIAGILVRRVRNHHHRSCLLRTTPIGISRFAKPRLLAPSTIMLCCVVRFSRGCFKSLSLAYVRTDRPTILPTILPFNACRGIDLPLPPTYETRTAMEPLFQLSTWLALPPFTCASLKLFTLTS